MKIDIARIQQGFVAAQHRFARFVSHVHDGLKTRPAVFGAALLVGGMASGAILHAGGNVLRVQHLQAQLATQKALQAEHQRQVNALSARLAELQAQANRLNALGERLTRDGQMADGEFDFDKPVGQGGDGPVRPITLDELDDGISRLEHQYRASGEQLSVMSTLLSARKADADALPSRAPVLDSYITSGFGGRADPFGGGSQFHKGIDFEANTGDPVLAVADGVISYAGVRSGYGNVIEVDHGNGYVTRYAHNSRLILQVGDLVRAGQEVAKAGSTGRSTGAHVHFEVWQEGRVVDPRQFLGKRSVVRG